MVTEIRYTSIKRVLDNLLDHPLLQDVSLEQAIRYTLRFISLHGYPKLYTDKTEDVEIEEWRGVLPCDLISIIQVKDLSTGICLRGMTDNFNPGSSPEKYPYSKHECSHLTRPWYIPFSHTYKGEPAFKTQGRIIYTSFRDGKVRIAYKAIPVDDDGYPLLIDNETYLGALEAYIKKQVFTVKFDTGKITGQVLQQALQDYAFLAAELRDEFTVPSVSEFEAISRSWNTLIPKMREFDKGFRNLGDREYLRRH